MGAADETPTERYDRYRQRYLPGQLARARLRVVHLEREAARRGLHDLIRPDHQA